MAPDTSQRQGPGLPWRAIGFGALALVGVGVALVVTLAPSQPSRPVASPIQWDTQTFDTESDSARQALAETPQDKQQVDELVARLERSAAQGDTVAMTRLGVMHKYGVGILQNYQLAASWIQRSAEAGSADGMLEFGRLHRDGVGVERNPVLAYVWFNRAAADLNMRAVKERDAVMRTLAADELRRAQELSAADEQEFMADSVSPGERKARSNP